MEILKYFLNFLRREAQILINLEHFINCLTNLYPKHCFAIVIIIIIAIINLFSSLYSSKFTNTTTLHFISFSISDFMFI